MKIIILTLALTCHYMANAQQQSVDGWFIKDIKNASMARHQQKIVDNTIAAEILIWGGLAGWYGIVKNPNADANLATFMRPVTIVATAAGLISGYSAYRHAYFRDKKVKAGLTNNGVGISIVF